MIFGGSGYVKFASLLNLIPLSHSSSSVCCLVWWDGLKNMMGEGGGGALRVAWMLQGEIRRLGYPFGSGNKLTSFWGGVNLMSKSNFLTTHNRSLHSDFGTLALPIPGQRARADPLLRLSSGSEKGSVIYRQSSNRFEAASFAEHCILPGFRRKYSN